MREILFRGKRIDNGQWVYGVPVIGITSGVFMVWIESETKRGHGELSLRDVVKQAEVIPETVGQYTGLKDKNGKEIFEGDIIAFEDSDGGYEYPDLVVNTGIVEYGELRFYFTNRVAVDMGDFYIKDGRCDEVEVIGNIHDNPELMV